jgi:hypothetical protein
VNVLVNVNVNVPGTKNQRLRARARSRVGGHNETICKCCLASLGAYVREESRAYLRVTDMPNAPIDEVVMDVDQGNKN